MKAKRIIYLILTIICTIFEICALALLCTELDSPNSQDRRIIICFIVGFFICLGISVWSYFCIVKNQDKLMVRVIPMRSATMLLTLAIMYAVSFDEYIEATILFGICGILLLSTAIFTCYRYAVDVKKTKRKQALLSPQNLCYRPIRYRRCAEQEYRILTQKDAQGMLAGEDNQKVIQYTFLPFLYLVRWLMGKGLLSQTFYTKYTQEEIDAITTGQLPTSDGSRLLQWNLGLEDVSEQCQSFLQFYVVMKTSITAYSLLSEKYFFDYYETLGAGRHTFFCLDYSDEDYQRLAAVLDTKYDAYIDRLRDYTKQVIHDAVVWNVFDKSLNIVCYQTENEKISEAYIESCKTALNLLPKRTLDLMFCRIKSDWEDYIIGEELEEFRDNILNSFVPDEMLLFMPRGGAEPAFVICGEADFEEEHGIAMVFRGQELLDVSYRMDYESPFSPMSERWYQDIMNRCDLTIYKDGAAIEEALQHETLIETKLVPENLKSKATGDGSYYLTPYAYMQKLKCDARVEVLCATEEITNITYLAEGNEPIPNTIRVKAQNGKDTVFQALIQMGYSEEA